MTTSSLCAEGFPPKSAQCLMFIAFGLCYVCLKRSCGTNVRICGPSQRPSWVSHHCSSAEFKALKDFANMILTYMWTFKRSLRLRMSVDQSSHHVTQTSKGARPQTKSPFITFYCNYSESLRLDALINCSLRMMGLA